MKQIASAMSSAAVNVRNGLSGLSSRIRGVRIALTTTMLAVAEVSLKESARASVQLSAAPLAAAYDEFVAAGFCACEEETSPKRPSGLAIERPSSLLTRWDSPRSSAQACPRFSLT